MLIIAGFLVFGLVVAIAAFLVIREAGRIANEPPAALFDPDDAYDWVVEHVPDDVAATLTPDDVRRILEFQVEFLERTGDSANGSLVEADAPVVLGSGDQIAYIVERSAATGEKYLPEQVDAVVETQLGYLRSIGAIGPPAESDGTPPPTH
jgi:hypothetical protein